MAAARSSSSIESSTVLRRAALRRAGLLSLSAASMLGACGAPTDARNHSPAVGTTQQAVIASSSPGCQDHDDDEDGVALRARAAARVEWKRPADSSALEVEVKLLGLNDFHGQLSPKLVGKRPAGGAAVLASYLQAASKGIEDKTIIVHAGDHVGASPPNSALLQDEPAITVLNLLANANCLYAYRLQPLCNVVGTVGNHEFDEGKTELFRLLNGKNHSSGPFLENPWRGTRFPYVSANVVDQVTKKPILPPYVIKRVAGVPIAFIGAVLKETPTIVTPTGVLGLSFLDEADAINSYVPELHARGVHAIVVNIHQGGAQPSFVGETDAGTGAPSGAILAILSRLDDDIDVVVSGHTHQFTNALVPNAHGKPILITQAFSAGTAYDDIDLVIDRRTSDVIRKSAKVVTTWGDEGPGLLPNADVAAVVAAADARVAPLVNRVIGQASASVTRDQNVAGESPLGDLIADAQRASVGADFAVMNPGGIRADLAAGTVTWGSLFTVQPFGNSVVKLTVRGQDLYDLLNQQWGPPQPDSGRILQISGFGYTWDSTQLPGSRVVEVRDATGTAIAKDGSYTIAANSFLATGGDNFTVLNRGTDRVGGPIDLDALVTYLEAQPQPFVPPALSRIMRR